MICSKGEPLKKVADRAASSTSSSKGEIDRHYAAGKKVVRDEPPPRPRPLSGSARTRTTRR